MTGVELLRATVFHTPVSPFSTENALVAHEDGALAIRDGRILASGDYATVRASYPEAETKDWRGGYLLPGFVDTHTHFPQARVIGGLGHTLLDWLNHVALPEEARMADASYATEVAQGFLRQLAAHGTTTALVFGAHFEAATQALFEAGTVSGLRIISGLVVSDRQLTPELHVSPGSAYDATGRLIRLYHGRGRLLYAITPRFALSTTEAMLEICQTLMKEHDGLRVQTHINENRQEVTEVARLFPWAEDYLAVYERYGLVGRHSVLAHSVWSTDHELARMAEARASVAHCPCSNAALGSGIFPFCRHRAARVHVALGTDVGGGTGFGILKEGLQAYLMQRVSPDGASLDPAALLYLSTRAGAEALGLDAHIGDFRPGKAADFVYLRPAADSALAAVLDRSERVQQSLAALFTLAGAESVREVRVEGSVVYQADVLVTLAELNACDRLRFVESVGWVFEHSPWVAERAWTRRPFGTIDQLHEAMVREMVSGTRNEQLTLLRAHPDLGSKAQMSSSSATEQKGAGLDQLSAAAFERLQRLNAAYREKFQFPFLFAVKGSTIDQILSALERRLSASFDDELAEALEQVSRIARFRLDGVVA